MALSKFQAVKMGSEHFTLVRSAADSAGRPALAQDFRRRAAVLRQALQMHGWQLLPDGINVERIR